jgi:hypothetical protein
MLIDQKEKTLLWQNAMPGEFSLYESPGGRPGVKRFKKHVYLT